MSKVIFSATMTAGDVTVVADLFPNNSARMKITLNDRDSLGSLSVEPLLPRMSDTVRQAVEMYFHNPSQAVTNLLARVAEEHEWLTFIRHNGLAYACIVDHENNRSTKARLEG